MPVLDPGRGRSHCSWTQCPATPIYVCSSLSLSGALNIVLSFSFSLLDLARESFTHVVGNISVAGDLVVSLCFS